MLHEGFVKVVSTLAPAWKGDNRPIYGGFFWINGDGSLPVPQKAHYMLGAGGQTTLIIPSHDLVAVRLGHYKGSTVGSTGFHKALALLMEAVPNHETKPAHKNVTLGRSTPWDNAGLGGCPLHLTHAPGVEVAAEGVAWRREPNLGRAKASAMAYPRRPRRR